MINTKELPQSILTKNQKKHFVKMFVENGVSYKIVANIRYDDDCGNGHNTFSITGTIYEKRGSRYIDNCGGCIHEEIAKHFPELEYLIKWHLYSSDGPMHYVANTVYLAGDKDCWGLRKDEQRQIINGKTGVPAWRLSTMINHEIKDCDIPGVQKYVDSEKQPEPIAENIFYAPWYKVGEGKEPQLESARKTAIWPDATLEQLTDKVALINRLPALMEQFKKDIEGLGFTY